MTGKHFDDLTAIDVPFGELDDETAAALFLAWRNGGTIEIWYGDHGNVRLYHSFDFPMWEFNSRLRLRPEPLTKPSFPWELLPPEFRWIAKREFLGDEPDALAFDKKPMISRGDFYFHAAANTIRIDQFTCYKPGTCDHLDSLVERPEGV